MTKDLWDEFKNDFRITGVPDSQEENIYEEIIIKGKS